FSRSSPARPRSSRTLAPWRVPEGESVLSWCSDPGMLSPRAHDVQHFSRKPAAAGGLFFHSGGRRPVCFGRRRPFERFMRFVRCKCTSSPSASLEMSGRSRQKRLVELSARLGKHFGGKRRKLGRPEQSHVGSADRPSPDSRRGL